MNKQRKVLITITYNEMGIIIDTKAEELSNDSPELDNNFGELISRNAALKVCYNGWNKDYREILQDIKDLTPAQPEQKAEELLPDGTLHFCTDTDLSKVTRVWVSQNGTHYGDLYYADGETEPYKEVTL